MRTRTTSMAALLAACGGVAGLAASAGAQPTVIHLSGATLLENFVKSRAATNDFIDADGDGISRGQGAGIAAIDQLAPWYLPASATTPNWPSNMKWAVVYSSVGSGNGFQELINWGRTFSTNSATAAPAQNPFFPTAITGSAGMLATNRTAAYYNRYKFINNGAGNNDSGFSEAGGVGVIFNSANPFGSPIGAQLPFTDYPTVPTPWNGANGSVANPLIFTGYWTPVGTASSREVVLQNGTVVNTTGANVTIGTGSGLANVGGMTVDMSPLDVPTKWFVTQTGTPNVFKNPLLTGYGNNAAVSRNKQGGLGALPGLPEERLTAGNQGNKLATLSGGANLFAGSGTGDANTIFDNPIQFAPICPITNFGTGLKQIKATELQHAFATGRMATGENLDVITRDAGSGTRNGFENSINQDPSWGVGDNVGVRSAQQLNDQVGPAWQPTYKNGNGNVEATCISTRLGLAYGGPERGSTRSGAPGWLVQGRLEIVDLQNDSGSPAGTLYVRPTIQNIVNNGTANGWRMGGPAVLATFGDPGSAPAIDGGKGFPEPFTDTVGGPNDNNAYDVGEQFVDLNRNGVRDAETEPRIDIKFPMRNNEAASFINNIVRSIAAFESDPGSDETLFTPGELAATQFILPDMQQFAPDLLDPIVWAANPGSNAALQTYIQGSSGSGSPRSVYGEFAFKQFGNATEPLDAGDPTPEPGFIASPNFRAGRIPIRTIPGTISPGTSVNLPDYRYSDDDAITAAGGVRGNRYVTEGGVLLTYGNGMPLRNLIAGDFSGDGVRNTGDIADMMAAYKKRHEGGIWTAPAGSGSLFTLADKLDGAIDGSASVYTVPGADFSMEASSDFNADGSFDRYDIRYFADGLAIATTGPHTGSLDRKAGFTAVDNSYGSNFFHTTIATNKAYANGDSRGDVAQSSTFDASRAIVKHTKGYQPNGADGYDDNSFTVAQNVYGPYNAAMYDAEDNRIDDNDIDYVYKNFKTNGVSGGEANWADLNDAIKFDLSADINGDLIVNQADVTELVTVILGTCSGDLNLDGCVSINERATVIANIAAAPAVKRWSNGDVDGDGAFTIADRVLTCPADFNCSGSVTVQDIYDFLSTWNSEILLPAPSNFFKSDINDDQNPTVQDIYDFLSTWNDAINAGGC